MKILVPALAAIMIFAVGFVLVELRAPLAPSSAPPAVETPAPVAVPPPVAAPPRPAMTPRSPLRSTRAPALEPQPVTAPGSDPLDVVVRGKTRREWHAYYTERQLKAANEIRSYQVVVDRAIAGEEPDPRELSEAHTHIAELRAQVKADLQELQQIDGPP